MPARGSLNLAPKMNKLGDLGTQAQGWVERNERLQRDCDPSYTFSCLQISRNTSEQSYDANLWRLKLKFPSFSPEGGDGSCAKRHGLLPRQNPKICAPIWSNEVLCRLHVSTPQSQQSLTSLYAGALCKGHSYLGIAMIKFPSTWCRKEVFPCNLDRSESNTWVCGRDLHHRQ